MSADHAQPRPSLADLIDDRDFITRHIGPSPLERDIMLAALGVASADDLIAQTVPASILLDAPPPPRPAPHRRRRDG